jgi:arsenate reductase (thioredoxin)
MTTTPTVLFVCLHGSAKSVVALEHFRRLAKQRGVTVVADSVGLEPDAKIPSRVIEGLADDGIDVRGRHPRGLTAADVAQASHVVTFACDLGALDSASAMRERWDDVPAVSDGYKSARDAIVAHVTSLLDSLSRH